MSLCPKHSKPVLAGVAFDIAILIGYNDVPITTTSEPRGLRSPRGRQHLPTQYQINGTSLRPQLESHPRLLSPTSFKRILKCLRE